MPRGAVKLQVWQSPNHNYGQMGNFKDYTTFNKRKRLGQTAPSAWKCLKTQFWGPLTNWKFEPSSKAPTHSDLIINKHTEQVKKLHMDLSWHVLNSTLQAKTLSHWKARIWLPVAFKKKFRHTYQNPLRLSPVSEMSAYPLQNYICFSPLTSGLESFGHKSTPSDRPCIEAYCQKF